jgi:hypothetical protein
MVGTNPQRELVIFSVNRSNAVAPAPKGAIVVGHAHHYVVTGHPSELLSVSFEYHLIQRGAYLLGRDNGPYVGIDSQALGEFDGRAIWLRHETTLDGLALKMGISSVS